MVLQIELHVELQRRLESEAAKRGLEPVVYGRVLLERQLNALAGGVDESTAQAPLCETATIEEWDRIVDEMSDTVDPSIPPLPDSAVHRSSFY